MGVSRGAPEVLGKEGVLWGPGGRKGFRAHLTCGEAGRRAPASGRNSGSPGSPGPGAAGAKGEAQRNAQAAPVPASSSSAALRAQGSGRQALPGGAGGSWASGSGEASVRGHMAGGGRLQPGPGPRAL